MSTAMAAPSVTLGIDLGTTSVKAAVVEDAPGDPSGFVVLASCVRAARAEVAAQSAAAGPQVRQRPEPRSPQEPPDILLPQKSPWLLQLPEPLGLVPVAALAAGTDLPLSGFPLGALPMALYPCSLPSTFCTLTRGEFLSLCHVEGL